MHILSQYHESLKAALDYARDEEYTSYVAPIGGGRDPDWWPKWEVLHQNIRLTRTFFKYTISTPCKYIKYASTPMSHKIKCGWDWNIILWIFWPKVAEIPGRHSTVVCAPYDRPNSLSHCRKRLQCKLSKTDPSLAPQFLHLRLIPSRLGEKLGVLV